MKMKICESKTLFVFAWAILICLFLVSFADAQQRTAKRKTTRRAAVRPTTAILVPLPLPQTEPEIVSRAADDDASQNQIIVTASPEENAPESLDQKIDKVGDGIKDLRSRVKSLETNKQNAYDEKQKRLALNLDILTKAETRAESLRKQMFEMAEKEDNVKTRLDQLQNNLRPEMIDRNVAFTGSLRPEELREAQRKNMESERQNLQNLLNQIQASRANLDANVQRADALVEKLRFKLEKDIDDALTEEPK
jgi:valyl-tRNA synthetase